MRTSLRNRNGKHANGNVSSNGNGSVTPMNSHKRNFITKSNRSSKVLLISLVIYAISMQLMPDTRGTFQPSDLRYNQQVVLEPPSSLQGERHLYNNLRSNIVDVIPNNNNDNENNNNNNNSTSEGLSGSDARVDQQQLSPSRRTPRSVSIDLSSPSLLTVNAALEQLSTPAEFKEESIPTDGPKMPKGSDLSPAITTPLSSSSSKLQPNELGPEYKNKECIPIHHWQLPKYGKASCNGIHEIDLMDPVTDFAKIACGSSRCAFRISTQGGKKIVIKIAKSESEDGYSSRNYKDNWLDTTIMERTTSSPFVLSVYGSCGVSQLIEYAIGGNAYDLIAYSRIKGDKMTPLDKLKMGFHIASGTAAVHTIDSDNSPSLAHNDLCCHQFILIDGVYKLNDFNQASIIQKSRKDESICKEQRWGANSRYHKLRPPEEVILDNHEINRDESDVWMVGNVLYYILTKRWIFERRTNKEALKLVLQGKRSEIPEAILNSTNPADQVMMKGIEMAWTQDPGKRPSAKQVADFLYKNLLGLNGNNPKDYRISVPPLPHFSDKDFNSNADYKHDK